MKTLKRVDVIPVFVQYVPKQDLMEEGKIYISREYESASHLCLCGCKELTVTPLNQKRGGWTLTENGDKISLSPSISNYQTPCKSHYIITNNRANFV